MGFVVYYILLTIVNICVIFYVHKDKKKYPYLPPLSAPYWMWFTFFYIALILNLFNIFFFGLVYE